MANFTSISANATGTGVSLDNTRRKFDFGDRVAELAPQQSPFFVYLNKVSKKPTNDPVFKFLEQRHQYQRRNFVCEANGNMTAASAGAALSEDIVIAAPYNSKGKIQADCRPEFIVGGLVLAIQFDQGVKRIKIAEAATSGSGLTFAGTDGTDGQVTIAAASMTAIDAIASNDDISAGAKGQVIGSAWAEGTDSPEGWEDLMSDSEGYCQIFKTGMNVFSGTALATEYRGIKNEFQRIWTDKLMEHKMDMEQAFLFGLGNATAGATTTRYTHGIVPYTEANGKVYNMTYASSGYDAFLDAMEDFFAPEGGNSGNKLVLASRKVITYLNKLGSGSFLNNTVGTSQYNLDVQNIKGAFGHQVTMVNTIFGNLHFVAEPLMRGPWEDYCVAVDMKNVAYRPLVGNGVSRDTFIETNIQDNGVDGRQDQVITESGLEISLPETHAVLKFS